MTTTEHLNAIKAKCHNLLAIAEKRTPGRWVHGFGESLSYGAFAQPEYRQPSQVKTNCNMACVCLTAPPENTTEQDQRNAAFIASAAGPFEASLLSTIAAIEAIEDRFESLAIPSQSIYNLRDSILTAWPIELLQNP